MCTHAMAHVVKSEQLSGVGSLHLVGKCLSYFCWWAAYARIADPWVPADLPVCLPSLNKNAVVTDVSLHIWLLIWVLKIECKLPG